MSLPLNSVISGNLPACLFPGDSTSRGLQPPALSELSSQPTVSVSLWSFRSLSLKLALLLCGSQVFLSVKKIYIYLFGCSRSYLQYIGSLAVACEIWFPSQPVDLQGSSLGLSLSWFSPSFCINTFSRKFQREQGRIFLSTAMSYDTSSLPSTLG